MAGMAEPDIAIDIVASASAATEGGNEASFTPRARLASLTLLLVGMDAAATALAGFVCYALFNPGRPISAAGVVISMACVTVCLTLSFSERGLYMPPEIVSRQVPWRKIVLAWLQAVAIGTLATYCLAAVSGHGSAALEGAWLPAFLLAGFGAVAGARLVRLRFHAGSRPLNRTVIIGESGPVRDLILQMTRGRSRNFDVIGVVEHSAEPVSPGTFAGLPLLGDLDGLERMIRRDAVDTVLVALEWPGRESLQMIIQRISMAPVDVFIYPGMNGLDLKLRRAGREFEVPLLMACTRPIGGWRAMIKRAEDVVLAAAVLAFISPVMLAIAAGIKLTSRGPVLFRQRRLGYNNRVIEVLKFRSMYTHLSDTDATQQAVRGDKRVTPLGVWLRKTSLDELPQLLNVLRGDMSLVGPRPHALATTAGGLALEEAVPDYPSRHRVKPGITGLAQVNGYRGALDSVDKIVHRVNHDLFYIENWSLVLDLKILWRTAKLIFDDDNAF